MTTAIARTEEIYYDNASIMTMAEMVVQSKLYGFETVAQAFTIMMLSQAHGMHPMLAIERYHIIKGKPSKKSETMLAEFQQAGGVVEWRQYNDECCEAEFISPEGGRIVVKWDIARAQRAQLYTKGGMYDKFGAAMLRSRVISEAIKTLMPGIVLGIYTPEEIMDMNDTPKSFVPDSVALQVSEPAKLQEIPQAVMRPIETGEINNDNLVRFVMENTKNQSDHALFEAIWHIYHNDKKKPQSDKQCLAISATYKQKGTPAIQHLKNACRIMWDDKLNEQMQKAGLNGGIESLSWPDIKKFTMDSYPVYLNAVAEEAVEDAEVVPIGSIDIPITGESMPMPEMNDDDPFA